MDAVEEIKQRLSIEDVIGQYVELKRAGRNFKGLSPFGNEKTASFMVSPEKQIWHDFSSGKGGNMFSFVMEMEGVDFKGALEILARKAGVELSQYQRQPGETKLKEKLSAANELAARFYQVHLSKNNDAVEYVFKKRHIDKATALSFRLGYAPNNGSALTEFAVKKDFTIDQLRRAGLTTKTGRAGDMFRSRIMVPLMDAQGQVIGFTGRLLEDLPNAPKYLNTPQTPLYDKSRHVFGLHLAKEAIRKSGYAVIVEGNLDVIMSHQVGVNNVVATAGTAITEQHLKTLGRFVHDVRLAFDQDDAGIAATERAIPLASKAGVNLNIVTVKGAKDADELIQKKGVKAWQQSIDEPEYALDWLIRVYQDRLDLTKAPDKRQYSDVMLAVIRGLQDPVEQEHYLAKLGQVIGVSKDALVSKLNSKKEPIRLKKTASIVVPSRHSAEVIKSQNHLLALALKVPNLRSYLQPLSVDMLPEEPGQKLLMFLKEHKSYDGTGKPPATLSELQDYVKILGVIFEELYQNLETLELRYEAARLQVRLIENYVKTQKQPLTAALTDATDSQADEILKKVKALDALLKLTKEGDA